MTRYFKPRKDLEYSAVLLPQKIVNNLDQYRYEQRYGYGEWRMNHSGVDLQALADNFIEVRTEAEALDLEEQQ